MIKVARSYICPSCVTARIVVDGKEDELADLCTLRRQNVAATSVMVSKPDLVIANLAGLIMPWIANRCSPEEEWMLGLQDDRSEGPGKAPSPLHMPCLTCWFWTCTTRDESTTYRSIDEGRRPPA